MSDVQALKPCPFCDDPMRIDNRSGIIRHKDMGDDNDCPIVAHAFTDVRRWNTRAHKRPAPVPSDELVEVARRAFAEGNDTSQGLRAVLAAVSPHLIEQGRREERAKCITELRAMHEASSGAVPSIYYGCAADALSALGCERGEAGEG